MSRRRGGRGATPEPDPPHQLTVISISGLFGIMNTLGLIVLSLSQVDKVTCSPLIWHLEMLWCAYTRFGSAYAQIRSVQHSRTSALTTIRQQSLLMQL